LGKIAIVRRTWGTLLPPSKIKVIVPISLKSVQGRFRAAELGGKVLVLKGSILQTNALVIVLVHSLQLIGALVVLTPPTAGSIDAGFLILEPIPEQQKKPAYPYGQRAFLLMQINL
jgi:hypothetical protein